MRLENGKQKSSRKWKGKRIQPGSAAPQIRDPERISTSSLDPICEAPRRGMAAQRTAPKNEFA
jgi:hypothetical protein